MDRRSFLLGSGCALALPALNSFGQTAGADNPAKVKRVLMFGCGQGFYTPSMYRDSIGADHAPDDMLAPLDAHKDRYTLIGGLQHTDGSRINHHRGQPYLFTGYMPGAQLRDSWDQAIAKSIGHHTRVGAITNGGSSFRDGLPVMGAPKPRDFFDVLFGKIDKKKEAEMLAYRKSLLDYVWEDAKRLDRRVSAEDRVKLEEYYESVRSAQASLVKKNLWLNKPQAQVDYPAFEAPAEDKKISHEERVKRSIEKETAMVHLEEMLSMVHLAFKHDVTRIACIYTSDPTMGFHGATHMCGITRGQIAMTQIGKVIMDKFARTFDRFAKTEMPGGNTLMDETATVMTTTLGINTKIGSHSSADIPMIIAGGGLKHTEYKHLAGGTSPCNVYLSVMKHMGVKTDTFANSTGTFDV